MSLTTSANDVKLTLRLPRTVFVAGDHVKGSIEVEAQRDVRVTAIRFTIVGKEKARYTPQKFANLTSLAPLYDSFEHYRKRLTLFGATSASGDKRGVVLTRGHHSFAIDLQLPFSCPPSFHCVIRGAASTLTYRAKAALFRSSSSSATDKDVIEQRLFVLAAVPMRQLTETQLCEGRMAREMVQVNSRTKAATPERVLVEASVYPSLLLLQPPDIMALAGSTTLASSPTTAAPADAVLTPQFGSRASRGSPAPVVGTPLTTTAPASASEPPASFSRPSTHTTSTQSPAHEASATRPQQRVEGREWCSHVRVLPQSAAPAPSQRRAFPFFPTHVESLHRFDDDDDAGTNTHGQRLPGAEGNALSRRALSNSALEGTDHAVTAETQQSAGEANGAAPVRRPSQLHHLARLVDFQRLQNERAFKVSVSVTNTSESVPLTAVRVSLLQQRRVQVRGASQSESVTLACAEVRDPTTVVKPRESSSSAGATAVLATSPYGDVRRPYTFTDVAGFHINPGEHVRLDVTLVMAEGTMPLSAPPRRRLNGLRELLRLVPEEEKHLPLPSLYTPFLNTSCTLEVTFPGISTSKKLNGKSYIKKGAVVISSAVDFTNLAWRAPATFDLCYCPPEENTGAPPPPPATSTDEGTGAVASADEYASEGGLFEYTPLAPVS